MMNAIFMIVKIVLSLSSPSLERKGDLLCSYSQKFTEIFSTHQVNSRLLAQKDAKRTRFSILVPILDSLTHLLPSSHPVRQD